MSVRVLTRVWSESTQKLGSLLVLLAIADFADDEGVAYPSVPTLAKKSRLSKRQVNYVLQKLTESGELNVEIGAGPHGANIYRVLTGGANNAGAESAGVQFGTRRGAKSDKRGVQSTTQGGAIYDMPLKEGTVMEPSCIEPSKNHAPTGEAGEVFVYWRDIHGHPNARLDDKRRKVIEARLKQYSTEELKTAIDGCKLSAFHQGQNDRNTIYDDISLICRDASHVDRFIAFAEGRANGKGNSGPLSRNGRAVAMMKERYSNHAQQQTTTTSDDRSYSPEVEDRGRLSDGR